MWLLMVGALVLPFIPLSLFLLLLLLLLLPSMLLSLHGKASLSILMLSFPMPQLLFKLEEAGVGVVVSGLAAVTDACTANDV